MSLEHARTVERKNSFSESPTDPRPFESPVTVGKMMGWKGDEISTQSANRAGRKWKLERLISERFRRRSCPVHFIKDTTLQLNPKKRKR